MACREGIALAAQWTPRRAILESDCSRAIKYLSNPEEQRTSSAFVIREAKELVENLPEIMFKYVEIESRTL